MTISDSTAFLRALATGDALPLVVRIKLGFIALEYERMRRTLDEITADAAEDERLRHAGGNVVPFPPPSGFFAQLTSEQQSGALAYRGPEGHGSSAWLCWQRKERE